MTIAAPLLPLYQVSPGRGRTPAVDAIVMNTPLSLRAEVRHRVPRGQEQALHVDAVDPVELVLGHVEHRLVAVRGAGVVDDDVEVAVFVEREARRAPRRRRRCDTSPAQDARAAAGGDDLAAPRAAPLAALMSLTTTRGALLREALRDALAESRTAAGDDRDLVAESHCPSA